MAPLHKEYGSGHSLIMQSNLRPSYLRVNARAAKRLSCFSRRCTNPDSTVRERINEQVDPTMEAVAKTSQLRGYLDKQFIVANWIKNDVTYPFQNPNISPDIVPNVVHPIKGGNDTTIMQSQTTI
jgi:hypothetical protein